MNENVLKRKIEKIFPMMCIEKTRIKKVRNGQAIGCLFLKNRNSHN